MTFVVLYDCLSTSQSPHHGWLMARLSPKVLNLLIFQIRITRFPGPNPDSIILVQVPVWAFLMLADRQSCQGNFDCLIGNQDVTVRLSQCCMHFCYFKSVGLRHDHNILTVWCAWRLGRIFILRDIFAPGASRASEFQ